MGNTVQYKINIAMELIMIFILSFLLIACILQKKKFSTTKPLMLMTGAAVLILLEQIMQWMMGILEIVSKYGQTPLCCVYMLDYILFYAVGVSFYYYVEALINDGYKFIKVRYEKNKTIVKIMLIWGVLSAFLYAIGLFIPTFFKIENEKVVFSLSAYLLMHLSVKFPIIYTLITMIKHRKAIKTSEIVLLFIFLILPSVLIIVDELFGYCISYVILSLSIFILYARIDLRRGIIIERQEKNLIELQTQIMLSQMQPHFLYNVLTTISSMCEMQNALDARDAVNRFANYFRTNLDSLGKERFISFEKELEHVKTYLWLEKIRFEDDLNVKYEIGPTDFLIPFLLVQPIVENAVKHGVCQKEDKGTVTIKTEETVLEYIITVEDDGVGFDINEPYVDNCSHIGLKNVDERVKLLCNGRLEVQSEIGIGTVVKIHIPKEEVK